MRFKDLVVGKCVTNNRYLRKYWDGCGNLMKIVELPKSKEDGAVLCDIITYCGCFSNDDVKFYAGSLIKIPYIHLHEIKDGESFRSWKVGDVIIPTEFGMKNNYALRNGDLYVITRIHIDIRNSAKCILAKRHNDIYERKINPIYFTKSDAVKVWNGIFANQYYSNQIRVEDGELIVPKEIKVGSPVYEQIVKEAKACGVI